MAHYPAAAHVERCSRSRLFAGGAAGQAGAAVELLQALPRVRCWILGAIEVDQVLLLLIGAGGADLVVELLQGAVATTRCWSWWVRIGDVVRRRLGWFGLLVKGLPGSRMRSGSSVLESTERVRTEAKRALAPGACRGRLRQRFRGFAFPPGPLGTEADSLPSLGRAGGWDRPLAA